MATEAEKQKCLQLSLKKMILLTGARSLNATRTPKSGEDNCWELTHLTMKRSKTFVQCLIQRSIMMLKSVCKRNVPEEWKRFTAHFSSSETPLVMNLPEQVSSLSLEPSEGMTDYLIRTETLSTSLDDFRKVISFPCF